MFKRDLLFFPCLFKNFAVQSWFYFSMNRYITAQRQKADPEKSSVQVLNFTINSSVSVYICFRLYKCNTTWLCMCGNPLPNQPLIISIFASVQNLTPTWITVHAQEDARSLLQRAIETLAIAVSIVCAGYGWHNYAILQGSSSLVSRPSSLPFLFWKAWGQG